jgi:hypothetical protein
MHGFGFDHHDDGFGSAFDDPFFSIGGKAGVSGGATSIKTSTYIDSNGQRVTKTEKTYIDSSGNQRTEVTKELQDSSGRVKRQQESLTDGGFKKKKGKKPKAVRR